MRVEQLMSKQVYWCRPEDTLDRAAQLMWDHDCGALPVCTGNGETHVAGMITDRDICMSALFQGRPLHEIRISDAMTRESRVCRPEDSAADAEKTMRGAQVRRLPVVSADGQLVGIISLADIAREAAREAQSQMARPEISEIEVGDTYAAIVESSRASAGASSGQAQAGTSPPSSPR
ncbi:MAG: CBS domain-containing protein [Gammaproteobacteria bacterium]|nr:CBS domain-containing protein [Gammaproteobacteria bacterium]